MTELLTSAQMRAAEKAAINRGEVTGLKLMERAGIGVVESIFEKWPELEGGPRCAVILCGPGNNGGDGFVVARLLAECGWSVDVFLYGAPEKLPPDARINCKRWAAMGDVRTWQPDVIVKKNADLWVDAIFGARLSRAPQDEVMAPLIQIFISGAIYRLIAIDAPTGLCMDSGRVLSSTKGAPYADLTITFHRARIGHYLGDGPLYCQKVSVVDIGLQDFGDRQQNTLLGDHVTLRGRSAEYTTKAAQPTFETPHLFKGADEHKYDHGHALILAGPPGHGGAARLAARGALRIGAGLVTLACPPEALSEHAAQLNAIMARPFDGPDGLSGLLSDDRLSSLVMGPGLGLTEATREMVEIVLKSRKKCVLDADALSIFKNKEEDLFTFCHENVILTPHAGEFKRLFPGIAAKLVAAPVKGPAYSKVDAVREAAAKAGCCVLLKGADTVIAHPNGRCVINSAQYERRAPWLATAGSGDVLAGFIGGLLARGTTPMEAAVTGAWLHVECARSFGPGLIAEDLPEELPKVFRALGATA